MRLAILLALSLAFVAPTLAFADQDEVIARKSKKCTEA